MISLIAGAQVDGLQVQRVLARNDNGFTYLVSDSAINTVFELREYAPPHCAQRVTNAASIEPLPGKESQFASGLKLFLQEGRLIARLDHPNLETALRFIEINGTAYQLKPHYSGISLADTLADESSLPRDTVNEWLPSLLDALAHCHEAGFIHLGISPQNIWLRDNGQPVLRGLHLTENNEAVSSTVAHSAYTAPEQLQTDGDIGPWTDIYALGATLYELTADTPPPIAQDRLRAIEAGSSDPLNEQLPPKEQRLPGLFETLLQSLELSPEARPQSIEAWRDTLNSLDWRLNVATAGPQDEVDSERRQWLPIALSAVVALMLIAIAVFLLSGRDANLEDLITFDDQQRPQTGASRLGPTDVEQARWEAALDADTLLGYRTFLTDFPDSIYADQAQLQINVIDERTWETLAAENTRSAYEDYLETFPLGLHQAEALQRIEAIDAELAQRERERVERERRDNAAWAQARQERTIDSMGTYIEQWPAGLHIEQAQRTLRELKDASEDDQAFATASKLDTKDAFQAYLAGYPNGDHTQAALEAIERLTLTPGKTFRDCELCPELRVMPVGAFRQGAADDDSLALEQEKPLRLVTLSKPFAIGIFEVTMGQWDACHAAGACQHRPPDNGWGRADRPVMMVSWNDAQEYISWLNETTGQIYRLPSESEWEYVARADETTGWMGGDPSQVCQFGNIAGRETGFAWQHEACSDPVVAGTVPVGAFKPNKAGIFDTIGNVAEWTSDCLNLSYLDAPVDGSAWTRGICSSHMTRGGSWVTGSKDIRLSARFSLKNGDRNDFTGFRVLREIDE